MPTVARERGATPDSLRGPRAVVSRLVTEDALKTRWRIRWRWVAAAERYLQAAVARLRLGDLPESTRR
eukprot:7255115-Lingulodinium_polyedra.AAC.1